MARTRHIPVLPPTNRTSRSPNCCSPMYQTSKAMARLTAALSISKSELVVILVRFVPIAARGLWAIASTPLAPNCVRRQSSCRFVVGPSGKGVLVRSRDRSWSALAAVLQGGNRILKRRPNALDGGSVDGPGIEVEIEAGHVFAEDLDLPPR